MDTTKLKKSLKHYQNFLVIHKAVSIDTAKGYSRSLSIALRRMRKFKPSYDDVVNHVVWLQEKNYSYSHVTNTMIAIEHYMELKGNPIKLTRPRKPRKLYKEFLSESEISRMIVAASTCNRKKALISLLAYSGIRNIELCCLKVKDINLGDNEINISSGKNKKDRFTNISSECTLVLIEYLKKFPREKDDYLFTTLKKGNQLASADVRKHIKIIARKAQIEKRVYPHLYRRSLASNLLNRGANIILIKNQLGHVFIETTMHYAQSLAYREKSQYDYYKPAYM